MQKSILVFTDTVTQKYLTHTSPLALKLMRFGGLGKYQQQPIRFGLIRLMKQAITRDRMVNDDHPVNECKIIEIIGEVEME